jgi:dienelactone hydrolase
MAADVLAGFAKETFTHGGKTRDIYRVGSGPAVIVISEVPGITARVAAFAEQVAAIGCTAVMPSLFGTPGKARSKGYELQTVAWACVSREFTMFARAKTSPVTVWLRALAAAEHDRCGGPGVGVVGMCLTGGFALAMMVDPIVLAPVLSQPSLPAVLPGRDANKRDLGISPQDLAAVKRRVADEDGLCVLGLRFTGDPLVPAARFERLREELGDAFVGVEIDSGEGNPGGHAAASHSVLTEHLVPEALEQVLDLFRSRLLVAGGTPTGT